MEKNDKPIPSVLNQQAKWQDLYFYQKSDVLYQLAFAFCERFIHLFKDRTRDQVIQAARSCKQNIVEGLADGVTSTEIQLKLLNVARASLQELREDFEDYIKSRHLHFYGFPHNKTDDERDVLAPYYDYSAERYDPMLAFCRKHNLLKDYEPHFAQWTDEEMCNYGKTLCHITDRMMTTFMKKLDEDFVKNGGIKERMHRARTGYRQQQDERLGLLELENSNLKQQLEETQQQAKLWKDRYDDLKQRALKAYNTQQDEIILLKEKIDAFEKSKQ